MATYIELYTAMKDTQLRQRIQVALWIICVEWLANGSTSQQKQYARAQLKKEADTDDMNRMAIRVIASGSDLTSDANLKTAVLTVATDIAG